VGFHMPTPSKSNLPVKLRGRPEAPIERRGCTLSSRTRGDTADSHGPLQRLLDAHLARSPFAYPDLPKPHHPEIVRLLSSATLEPVEDREESKCSQDEANYGPR
jgi:hypothetical protein